MGLPEAWSFGAAPSRPSAIRAGRLVILRCMSTLQDSWVTTTEAAKITGRTQDTIRHMINLGALGATRVEGRWYIDPDVLLAWNKQARRYDHIERPRAYDRAAELLKEYHSITPEELATLTGVHVGNARKHLALLAAQGRAERLSDGQWVLTVRQHQGAA